VEVLLQQQLLIALQVRQGGGRATHRVSEWVDRGCGFELALIVMLWCERVSEWMMRSRLVSSECDERRAMTRMSRIVGTTSKGVRLG
jgi:hypothetical protein